ncbi:MAG: hypothetical protein ACXV9R_12130, partial [Methylobacter sp.]
MKNKLYLAVMWGLAGAAAGQAGAAVDLFNSPVGVIGEKKQQDLFNGPVGAIGAQPVATDKQQAAAEVKTPQAEPVAQAAQAAPATPDNKAAAAETSAPSAKSKLWSYQPIKAPEQPTVNNKSWVRNPIDAFVLAPLEAKGLTPSPD